MSTPKEMATICFTILLLMVEQCTSNHQDEFLAAISNVADGKTLNIGHHLTRRDTEEEPGVEGKSDNSKASVTFDEKVNFLRWHNAYRSHVSPKAKNMEQMTWHDDLEALAQAWADQCVWEHGQPSGLNKPYSWVGQNMWTGTGKFHESWAVEAWYNEVKHYDFNDEGGSCSGVCGHYTQVVWGKSARLGCGIKFCPALQGFANNAYFIVCNYGPGGNYQNTALYKSGDSCSECPSDKPECSNNLCIPSTKCGGLTCTGSDTLIEDVCLCGAADAGDAGPTDFGGSAGSLGYSVTTLISLVTVSSLRWAY